MKILHISKYYAPYIGGVENICKYLVEGTLQHETAVVCFGEGTKDSTDMVNGHKVWRVGTWVNIARQALSPTYWSVLRRAIREFQPDVIHFHWANPFPAFVLLTVIPKHVRLVVHWHMDIIKQKRIYPLIKPVETALLKRADRVMVTSPIYRDHSLPLQPFKDKVDIVPNAFDENTLQLHPGDEERIKAIQTQYDNKPIVFFVGRHIQYKGLPYLIEAEHKVKTDCVFVIAGSGPLTEELKAQCQSERVHFVGRVTVDDLRCYHYAAKVFAFPSITKNEAFGVALAEAMYCHTPAVTFTIEGSGVNWVSINNETCLEVANRDSDAYAQALDRLLTDEALYARLSEASHQRAKKMFIIPKMVEACEESYNKILNMKTSLMGGVILSITSCKSSVKQGCISFVLHQQEERRAA